MSKLKEYFQQNWNFEIRNVIENTIPPISIISRFSSFLLLIPFLSSLESKKRVYIFCAINFEKEKQPVNVGFVC